MQIRSITLGLTKDHLFKLHNNEDIAAFFDKATTLFQTSGIPVRTMRLVLPVLNSWASPDVNSSNSIVKWLSQFCASSSVRWFCLPIDCSTETTLSENLSFAYECLKRYPNIFINLQFSTKQLGAFHSLSKIAKFITSVSRISANGFDNFRLGISCNCEANTPFFPYTFHEGPSGFSVAIENSSVFYEAANEMHVSPTKSLLAFRERVISNAQEPLSKIDALCSDLSMETGKTYKGMDISLAPFPESNGSVAGIIEKISGAPFGASGTTFYVSLLTDILKEIIKKSGIKAIGFNGVMLSLLEDQNLSQANSAKLYTLDSLISYSTVCGCGIDMVPIPGNALTEEISGIILDIFSISTKLNKPLGIRILPIPGKSENEFTNFNFDFIYNSRAVGIKNKYIDIDRLERLKAFNYLNQYGRVNVY